MKGLVLDHKEHKYRVHGELWPGVTEVLADVGIIGDWMQYIAEYHRVRGNLVHQATAWADEGRPAATADILKHGIGGYLYSWQQWATDMTFQSIEQPMGHKSLKFAGMPDRVLEAEPIPADIKTGKPERWHIIQVAAYSLLVADELGIQPSKEGICVYLDSKGGQPKVKRHAGYQFKCAQKTWVAALTVYNYRHRRIL